MASNNSKLSFFLSIFFLSFGILTIYYTLHHDNKTTNITPARNKTLTTTINEGENYLLQQLKEKKIFLTGHLYHQDMNVYLSAMIVTYYVTKALIDEHSSSSTHKQLVDFVYNNKHGNGWLDVDLPNISNDADNTAYAWHSLLLLNDRSNIENSLSSLHQFFASGMNAYSIWPNPHSTALAINPSLADNGQIQTDVNVVVFNYLHAAGYDHLINFKLLANTQTKAGYWQHYFYPSNYFVTYHALKLLCQTHQLPNHVNKGIQFLYSSQNNDGSWGSNPYETALALNSLLECGEKHPAIEKGITYLQNTQNSAGDWDTTLAIWRYQYTTHDALYAYDSNHVLTTALAVMALKAYSK